MIKNNSQGDRERDFELVSFSPAVKLLREERQTFRGVFQSDLFKGKHSKTQL